MKRIWTALPVIGLLAATAMVIVLSRQLDRSREAYDTLMRRTQSLQPGAFTPTYAARTVDGAAVELGRVAPGRRQVLFIYNTRCPFCRATIPAWQRIADRLRDDPRAQVVAVSLDSLEATRKYAAAHGLRYPTALLQDERASGLFRFRSVPQTIVIDERGRVMHARVGFLPAGAAEDSVLAAVARPLPVMPKAPVRTASR